jgi:hypothetical protein
MKYNKRNMFSSQIEKIKSSNSDTSLNVPSGCWDKGVSTAASEGEVTCELDADDSEAW